MASGKAGNWAIMPYCAHAPCRYVQHVKKTVDDAAKKQKSAATEQKVSAGLTFKAILAFSYSTLTPLGALIQPRVCFPKMQWYRGG